MITKRVAREISQRLFWVISRGIWWLKVIPEYRKLEPEIKLSCCRAHVRRKFDEALTALPEKNHESTAAIGLNYCNKLFDIEREIADKSIEERKYVRQEQSKAVCEAFFSWAEAESYRVLPKSLICKAIEYSLKLKKYLLSFLEDGRLELSNNPAEQSIKPFVIGRKNRLFCNTPRRSRFLCNHIFDYRNR